MDVPPPIPTTPSPIPPSGAPPQPAQDASKSHIRTFASDMEAMKRGGTSEFTHLREKLQSMVHSPVSAPSPLSQPSPSAPPIQAKPPFVPATLMPRPSAAASLETYSGDFTKRVNETHASKATILAAEQDSAPPPELILPEKPSRSGLIYSIAGGLLLIVAAAGAYFAYGKYLSSTAPVLLAPRMTAPIFIDDREQISGTGPVLVQAIQQSVARPLANGTVRLLYLEAASSKGVFAALEEPAPGSLARNINASKSMVGVVNVGGVQSPFIILSVTGYSETFAGMLLWEPKMPHDLSKLFPPYPQSSVGTTTMATSSVQTVIAGFFDATINNHDVRAYRDTAGRDILLYGYWNRTTLVIARDADAYTEILSRLATSRAQ